MTRLERKEAELNKLYEYRTAALRNNDVMWVSKNRQRIDALEKEFIAMRNESKMTEEKRVYSLTELLQSKPAELRARFYVAILRISMLTDVVNEACEEVNSLIKSEYNAIDFTLKKEVNELTNLSRRISSFACRTGEPSLEECVVDDEEFVDCCMKLATKHITSKLKIKTKI